MDSANLGDDCEKTTLFNESENQNDNTSSNIIFPPPKGYFATVCSRGMQRMALEEIQLRLQPNGVEFSQGKCFFSTNLPAEAPELRSVRSVERLFICLHRLDTAQLPQLSTDKLAALDQFEEVFVKQVPWDKCIACWRAFTDPSPNADSASQPITFKVKCNRSGSKAAHVGSEEIAGRVGRVLKERMGWTVDLKRARLEVNLYVTDEGWVAGTPVLRQAVEASGHILHAGLHPTVSWALARAGGISPGDVVLDPMCGRGVVLVEAARGWPGATFIAGDNDSDMVQASWGNFNQACVPVSVYQGSVTCLPLHSASVDVVLCDLPFGKMHGTLEGNKTLYPKVLCEVGRVVRPGGRAVLLTSDANSKLMQEQVGPDGEQEQRGVWRLVAQHPVKIGFKMPTHIYLLYRLGLSEEHQAQTIAQLNLKGSGWQVVCSKKSWRKRRMEERPDMQPISEPAVGGVDGCSLSKNEKEKKTSTDS